MEWEHWNLDGEPDEEGQEDPELQVNRQGKLVERKDIKRSDTGLLEVVIVQGNDTEQHQDAAQEGIKEELDGGIQAPVAAPDPDQEVHGDQHDFPEDIEQDEIEGHEDTEHPGFEDKQKGVILFDPVFDGIKGTGHGDSTEEGGQEHE